MEFAGELKDRVAVFPLAGVAGSGRSGSATAAAVIAQGSYVPCSIRSRSVFSCTVSPSALVMTFLLDVQELRRPSVVHSLPVKWSYTVRDVKGMIQNLLKFPSDRVQILRSTNSAPLGDNKTLGELGIDQEGHTLLVSLQFSASPQYILEPVGGVVINSDCKELINQVRQGLNANQVPAKTDMLDCTGGVYFMKSAQGNLTAVFKPQDEEQGMPSNPKGHAGLGAEGLRSYIKPGDGYLHEVAAYILDHNNFCQVPPTVIAHCEHPCFNYTSTLQGDLGMFPKIGSLQKYVRASDTFEDISPSLIGTLELQKIALLDIRLLNCDRNASNILAIRKAVPNTFNNGVRPRRGSRSGSDLSWSDELDDVELEMEDFLNETQNRKGKQSTDDMYELIPIDHGYCFPTKLMIEDFDWAWFHCPQISKPVDPAIREYVLSLDIDAMLKDLSEKIVLPEETVFLLRLVHQVLVDGINRGLTLRDIAGLIARTEDGKPSPLEKVIEGAEDNALRALEVQSSSLFKRNTDRAAPSKTTITRKSPVTVMQSVPVPSPCREPSGLRRMINSELHLQRMGYDGFVESLRVEGKDRMSYLSSENIQRLQITPDLTSKVQDEEVEVAVHDYFMNDLDVAPNAEADSNAPSRPIKTLSSIGMPLSHMKSLDGHYQSAPLSADARYRSYLTGSWLSVPESDFTASEASSSDFGSSPRFSNVESCMCSPLTGQIGVRATLDDRHDGAANKCPSDDSDCRNEKDREGRPRGTHPLRKVARPSRRRQRSDTTTTDDERENDSEESNSSDIADPLPLARVTSFGALHSPPLYDLESKSNRQLHLLKRARERGKSSAEFVSRRFDFAFRAVEQLVTKEATLLHAK